MSPLQNSDSFLLVGMVTSEKKEISPDDTPVEIRDNLRINSLKKMSGAPVYTLAPDKFFIADPTYHIDAFLGLQGTLALHVSY